MIRYIQKGLKPSIWAQLDAASRDLDSWKEAVEKAVNAKAKALLQSSSNTREMDSRYPRGSRPAKKEEKNSEKTKSADFPSTDTPNGKSTHQS